MLRIWFSQNQNIRNKHKNFIKLVKTIIFTVNSTFSFSLYLSFEKCFIRYNCEYVLKDSKHYGGIWFNHDFFMALNLSVLNWKLTTIIIYLC